MEKVTWRLDTEQRRQCDSGYKDQSDIEQAKNAGISAGKARADQTLNLQRNCGPATTT